MLVRRYIGKKLAEYYSQPAHLVVGSRSLESVNFSSLWGEWHWRRVYQRMYNQQEGQWLTPVELFRPYYSQILANFVAASCREETGPGIHVVEMGGGRGTNANAMLSHLQDTQPELYDRISYIMVDSSPSLHELQKQIVGKGEHGNKVDFVLRDLTDVAENKAPLLEESNIPTIGIALEVIDNLGHDKVRRSKATRALEQAELRQADLQLHSMDSRSNASFEEVFVPLTDDLLLNVLQKVPLYGGKSGKPSWVPSVACGVLERLVRDRPNSQLLLADFDWLPPPDIATTQVHRKSAIADGEPLVTDMNDTDHECYLSCPPFCDILFPTNLDRLASFLQETWGDDSIVQVYSQAEFLELYGSAEVDATKSWATGFSPLINDFGNCSILSVTNNVE